VDRGDGRDDGEAEAEAVVRRAVAEPLERLEDAVGIGSADDRPGIGYGQLAAVGRAAGADPDVAAGNVVPGRVVDQVRDEAHRQHRVTGDDGGLEGGVQAAVADVGGVEYVFRGGGQVDVFPDGEPALIARQQEQRADEVLGVVHGGADVNRHAPQVVGRGVRAAEHDVDGRAHDRERGAQLMRGVGHEPLLTLERDLQPAEHVVERLGQLAELVAWTRQRDPRRQVVLRRGAGGRRDLLHRAQHPPGEDPAKDRGEGEHHGQRNQRVLQQVGEGQRLLVLRALLLKQRDARAHRGLIGNDGVLLCLALRQDAGRNVWIATHPPVDEDARRLLVLP
jgi:hypothetical protein